MSSGGKMFVRTLARRALAVKTGTQNQYGHKIGIKFPNSRNPRRSDQHQGEGSLSLNTSSRSACMRDWAAKMRWST